MKGKCSGCSACAVACPKTHCIKMEYNEYGFLRPIFKHRGIQVLYGKLQKRMRLMLKRLMVMFGRTQKNKKKNNISADIVNGNIIQDSSVENNYISVADFSVCH